MTTGTSKPPPPRRQERDREPSPTPRRPAAGPGAHQARNGCRSSGPPWRRSPWSTIGYEHILDFSGTLGFLICWYLTFMVVYAPWSLGVHPRPIVVERLVTVTLWLAAPVVLFALGTTLVYTFLKGWKALVHTNFFTHDMSGVAPTAPLDPGRNLPRHRRDGRRGGHRGGDLGAARHRHRRLHDGGRGHGLAPGAHRGRIHDGAPRDPGRPLRLRRADRRSSACPSAVWPPPSPWR